MTSQVPSHAQNAQDARLAGEPFLIQRGPQGVLLVHGFMGYPAELRPLGDELANKGFTVSGVLLARHGGHPERVAGTRWNEWAASVDEAYKELAQCCESVSLVGYSLGGLLALHLASRRPVAAFVTLAAALQLQGGWPLRTLPVARYVMPWFYPMRNADWNDPQLREQLSARMGEINWDDPQTVAQLQRGIRIPTGAIYELVRLGRRVRRELPRITAPALVMQGRLDQTVRPISAEHIMSGLGSTDKQLAYFEHSGHGLPNDVERDRVRALVGDWLKQRLT